MAETQLTIDYPPDLELLATVADQGVMIASATTDRFSSMSALADMGLLDSVYCPRAGKVYQFTVTAAGRQAVEETQ